MRLLLGHWKEHPKVSGDQEAAPQGWWMKGEGGVSSAQKAEDWVLLGSVGLGSWRLGGGPAFLVCPELRDFLDVSLAA